MGLVGYVYSKDRGEDGGIRHVAVVVEEGEGKRDELDDLSEKGAAFSLVALLHDAGMYHSPLLAVLSRSCLAIGFFTVNM
jgi:hypothetical protein